MSHRELPLEQIRKSRSVGVPVDVIAQRYDTDAVSVLELLSDADE